MVLISDLWVPDIWISAIRERQATFPVLFQSKVVTRAPLFDTIAAGPGTTVNLPFFKDITDQDDEIQVENTPPVTDNGQPGSVMVATPLNRVCKNSSGALAAQLSGADPMAAIIDQMLMRRMKQNQKTFLAMLRGQLGTAGAANAAAALAAMRVGGTTAEPFIENGAAATDDNLMSPDLFIDAKALMGELADDLANGVFWCHTDVRARLEKLDALNFRTLQLPSQLPF
ncbi:MAG TPA: hypothetical protein VFB72_14990, partial [Verrucomicrobiae bacterium]|nr:hypothetical protein [Verrucomicrobiae bacterium]